MLLRRYRARSIDSPQELGMIIVTLAITFAAKYFIRKFFPDISERLLNGILTVLTFLIILIWIFVVPSDSN